MASKTRKAKEKYLERKQLAANLIAEATSKGYVPRALLQCKPKPLNESTTHDRVVKKIQSRHLQRVPSEWKDARMLAKRILSTMKLPSQGFTTTVERFLHHSEWTDVHELFDRRTTFKTCLFLLLAAGGKHLGFHSFALLIESVIVMHPRIREGLLNADLTQAYHTYVCLSIFFKYSKRRCHKLTAQEFESSNLDVEFLRMCDQTSEKGNTPASFSAKTFQQKRAEFHRLSQGKRELSQTALHPIINPVVLANWVLVAMHQGA